VNGHYERRIWEPSPGAYPPLARLRRGFAYEAFVPNPIAERSWSIPASVAENIVRAETAVRALNMAPSVAGVEALSRLLLRAESISSSQIEGLVVSQRRLAQALYDPDRADEIARSVMNNIRAMERAIVLGSAPRPLTVGSVCDLHATLLEATAQREHAGMLRTEQDWIGGRLPAPLDAGYIPPPPEYVPPLMEDLVTFCVRADLPAVFQAGIAHAQFETIHPFVDGNGRVGRALIHVILHRRGAIATAVPPISNVLVAGADRYVAGLTGYRSGHLDDWSSLFAGTIAVAAVRAQALARAVELLQAEWIGRLGKTRADSTARTLVLLLPSAPVLDAARAAGLTGVSAVSARKALIQLEEAGAVRLLHGGARRQRVWVADDLLGMLNAFEWDLAGPPIPGEHRRAPRGTQNSLDRYLEALRAEQRP
jgi:Fic family protein